MHYNWIECLVPMVTQCPQDDGISFSGNDEPRLVDPIHKTSFLCFPTVKGLQRLME